VKERTLVRFPTSILALAICGAVGMPAQTPASEPDLQQFAAPASDARVQQAVNAINELFAKQGDFEQIQDPHTGIVATLAVKGQRLIMDAPCQVRLDESLTTFSTTTPVDKKGRPLPPIVGPSSIPNISTLTPSTAIDLSRANPEELSLGDYYVVGSNSPMDVDAFLEAHFDDKREGRTHVSFETVLGWAHTAEMADQLQKAYAVLLGVCYKPAPPVLPPQSATSISGASLGETVGFINKASLEQGAITYQIRYYQDNGGERVLEVHTLPVVALPTPPSCFLPRSNVNIGSIDPREINMTDEKDKLQQQQFLRPEIYSVSLKNGMTLALFTDRAMAERVAKAFIHASILCGAKADPF
jgi:hypothetical protein